MILSSATTSLAINPPFWADRAQRPPLAEPPATDQELTPGDRVEGLGNFGKPNGEFGTVQQANEDDARQVG